MIDVVHAKMDLLQSLRAKYPQFASRITPSVLRLSAGFDSDTLEYQTKKTEGKYRSDVKLRDNDIFFFNLISLGWSKTTSGQAGKDQVLFYPDPTFETNWQEVETQYNGGLQLVEGDQNIIVPTISTTVFRTVSEQQYTETTGVANTLPNTVNPFFYMGVGVGLSGNKDYTFKLTLGQGTRDNITTHRSIVMLDGFVIPGAATSITLANT